MENNDHEKKDGNKNVQNKYFIKDISEYNISRVNENENISGIKEIIFKIIVIGDIGVGKSSIIQSIIKETEPFKENYKATLGFDIFKYKSKVKDVIINLNIWDTCGLKEFSSCTPSLFKNAVLAIIVYEINNLSTFDNLGGWVNLLKLHANPDILTFIVGNKNDLEDKRQIKKKDGQKYVEENNFNFFIETSAKDKTFVKELFEQGLAQLYEYYKNHENNKDDEDDEDEEVKEKEKEDFTKNAGSFNLTKKKHNKKGKKKGGGGCC